MRSLWDSLQKQTIKDFEWLIVDDGSIDGTKNLITQLQEKSDFQIRYIYKNNSGKYTALNVGIQTICSKLTFIVDSDDCVTDDAVESILKIHKKYRPQNNICGYAFLRAFLDGRVNGKKFDVDEKIGSCIDVRVNSDDTSADKAEEFMEPDLKIKYRIKGALQYIIYGKFAGVKIIDLIRKSKNKILVTVCIPGGLFLHSRWSKAQ